MNKNITYKKWTHDVNFQEPTIINYSVFYSSSHDKPIKSGDAIPFACNGNSNNIIKRSSPSKFILPTSGIYEINFEASISTPGKMVITINGVEIKYSIVEKYKDNNQINGMALIHTTSPNSILCINNPIKDTMPLMLIPGSTQHLIIKQLL